MAQPPANLVKDNSLAVNFPRVLEAFRAYFASQQFLNLDDDAKPKSFLLHNREERYPYFWQYMRPIDIDVEDSLPPSPCPPPVSPPNQRPPLEFVSAEPRTERDRKRPRVASDRHQTTRSVDPATHTTHPQQRPPPRRDDDTAAEVPRPRERSRSVESRQRRQPDPAQPSHVEPDQVHDLDDLFRAVLPENDPPFDRMLTTHSHLPLPQHLLEFDPPRMAQEREDILLHLEDVKQHINDELEVYNRRKRDLVELMNGRAQLLRAQIAHTDEKGEHVKKEEELINKHVRFQIKIKDLKQKLRETIVSEGELFHKRVESIEKERTEIETDVGFSKPINVDTDVSIPVAVGISVNQTMEEEDRAQQYEKSLKEKERDINDSTRQRFKELGELKEDNKKQVRVILKEIKNLENLLRQNQDALVRNKEEQMQIRSQLNASKSDIEKSLEEFKDYQTRLRELK